MLVTATSTSAMQGGFNNVPTEAARQFRAIMNAIARPGRIETLGGATPPAPMSVAAGVIVLTLCDPDTGLHLAGDHDTPDIRAWVQFHTGAPFVPAENANFAIGRWEALSPLTIYAHGTPEYPDRSATLIIEMDALSTDGAILTGPGIEDSASLSLPEIEALKTNALLFPLGLDFFFCADTRLASLPRTTKVTEGGAI
ncbi:phosphonate C-P lyase system protein PhnH [Aliiroseovarius sp. PrR006]|uniref:phosphonate C-P lyase system protein PhnH n=1 Tax=Aliiroseovarius sp. PrR006 TaxID=2706883 RepID=UPI0013D22FF0|nr:phosphonate C-P lyase system protein PhnH [Aliiroseovarius sp. PrR006]NDW53679.1 phosphonate C-P lyase system protein PhnH [Aliiroseovarius sp. PrR006]